MEGPSAQVRGQSTPAATADQQHTGPWLTKPPLCLQCYVNLLFWYQFFCGFSGSTMIDYWQMIFFNLFFTSLPPIIFGILDKDISAETLLELPELYKNGQNSEVKDPCSQEEVTSACMWPPSLPGCQRKSTRLPVESLAFWPLF